MKASKVKLSSQLKFLRDFNATVFNEALRILRVSDYQVAYVVKLTLIKATHIAYRFNVKEQVLESPTGHGITDIPFRASGSTCFVIIGSIASSTTKRCPYLSSPWPI